MTKLFQIIFILFTLTPADSFSFFREVETLNYEGKFYSIQVVKSDPIQIYIFDNTRTQVDLSTVDVELFAENSEGEMLQPARLRIFENHFLYSGSTKENYTYTLDIASLSDNKKESFKLKLNRKFKKKRQSLLESQ